MLFIVVYIAVILLCLYKNNINPLIANEDDLVFFEDYLSVGNMNSVKGIFMILIMFSHATNNIAFSDNLSLWLRDVVNWNVLGTNIVSMFLLYSGWAVMYCIKNRGGAAYVNSIPKRRISKVVLQYELAAAIIILLSYVFGITYSVKSLVQIILAWKGFGMNGEFGYNWYIFVIVILYLFTYMSFNVFRNNDKKAVLCVLILTIIFSAFMFIAKNHTGYWYQTNLLYPIGMIWFIYQKEFEDLLRNKKTWLFTIALLIVGTIVTVFVYDALGNSENSILKAVIGLVGIGKTIVFGLLFLVLSMRVQIHNGVLEFYGKHLLPLFMLQIIPMMALNYFGMNTQENAGTYFLISFAIATLLCKPFDWLSKNISDRLICKT